jgi:hypothetical protein
MTVPLWKAAAFDYGVTDAIELVGIESWSWRRKEAFESWRKGITPEAIFLPG